MSTEFHDRPEPLRNPWISSYPKGVSAHIDIPRIPAWKPLTQSATDFPDRIACHFFDQQLTYKELLLQSRKFAESLVQRGIQPGDRVGILLPNMPEYLVALNGIWLAGAVAVPISPLLVAREVSELLETTQCKVIVALDMFESLIEQSRFLPKHLLLVTLRDRLSFWKQLVYPLARWRRNGHFTPGRLSNWGWWEEVLSNTEPLTKPVPPIQTPAPAVLLSTGGTTGHSKTVMLSHRNLIANTTQMRHWVNVERGTEKLLAVLPFFHSFGLTVCGMTAIDLATTLILFPRFHARSILQLIDKHQPTVFPAVPTMIAALNRQLKRSDTDLSSIQYCISGGAPLDAELARDFHQRSGCAIAEGYGLSEAGPVTHVGPLDGTARTGTIGLPLPNTDARIVDTESGTRELELGEVGELVVRGPQVMNGYWNDPGETRRVIRDQWLHTGDLAICDSDGFFRIVDRKKDLIINSGFNVFPTEVEDILRQFPGISDVAVIGIPDPKRGQLVKALIVLEPGNQLRLKELDRYCADHLAKYKRPHLYEQFKGTLPRNFLGKLLRRELRDSGSNSDPMSFESSDN